MILFHFFIEFALLCTDKFILNSFNSGQQLQFIHFDISSIWESSIRYDWVEVTHQTQTSSQVVNEALNNL